MGTVLRSGAVSRKFAAMEANATVAQLVEQYFRKVEVGGSSPPGGSRETRFFEGVFFDA